MPFPLPRENTADSLLYLPRTSLSGGTTVQPTICYTPLYLTVLDYNRLSAASTLSSETTAVSLLRSTLISETTADSLLRSTLISETSLNYLLHSAPLCLARRLPTICCALLYLMVLHYSRLSTAL
jgi:hypothetical protein